MAAQRGVTVFEVLQQGGFFSYIIMAYAMVLYGVLAAQYARFEESDYTSFLWGLCLGLVALGFFGTGVGFIEVFEHTGDLTPNLWYKVVCMATIPTTLGLGFSVPALILTGFAGTRLKNR